MLRFKKGHKHSEKTKMKLSESKKGVKNPMYGKPLSIQHRKKISQSLKGITTHNKGKKGYTNKGSFKKGHKISEETRRKLKGRIPPNKGKKGLSGKDHPMFGKHHSKAAREKISKAGKGRKHSEDWKNKASERMAGKKNPFYGKKHDEPTRKIIKEKRSHQVFPREDTKGEKILQKLCKNVGIQFLKHKNFDLGFQWHQVDLFIKPNICIESDGDYWHGNPNDYKRRGKIQSGHRSDEIISKSSNKTTTVNDKRKSDNKITKALIQQGNVVLRFWESELEENPEKCIRKIIKIIKESRR